MRRRPYTQAALSRTRCVHCGATAAHQWSLRPCAIGSTGWYALCTACDIELNGLVMAFLKLPDATERLAKYREKAYNAGRCG